MGEQVSCEIYSTKFFGLCAMGGSLSCGLTHFLITPLDVVKCRLQVDPDKYKSLIHAFRLSIKESGLTSLMKGWAPALIGYSLQGAPRFGLFEYLKYKFFNLVDEETAYKHRVLLYLAAAACAEFVADIPLAPFEATKVRMQTTHNYTSRITKAMPLMWTCEGISAFYRGLLPLWGRQIPYTMAKFSTFERTLEYLYQHVVPKKQEECTKGEQLVVTFTAGYLAGVLCAIVSHPSDTIISKLNKDPHAHIGEIITDLGFMGIWRGLFTRIIMIGALTGMQWFIYDGFKVYTRMPRPPPPIPPVPKKNDE